MKKLFAVLVVCLTMVGMFAAGASEQPAEAVSTEKPVLNYVYVNVAFNPDKEPIKQVLEDVTGYQVKYNMLPADNPSMKLSMDLASGSMYDMVRIDSKWFAGLVGQNALLPLNDLIDQYGPNIKSAIKPEFWDSVTVNGKIYGVPTGTANPNGIYWGIAFRKDILDANGIEVPSDLDSFTECLRDIKNKTGLIPLTTTEPTLDTIKSAFGLSTYSKDVNGNLVLLPQQEGMYDYLAYMNMLYKEGLIDQDLAINKRENVQEKFVSGQAVGLLATYGSQTPMAALIPALKDNAPDAELVYVLPLADKDGNRVVPKLAGVSDMTVIPANSKYAVDVIKYLDAILESENSKLIAIGEEGVHFTDDNGVLNPILPKFFEERGNSWWLVPNNNSYDFPNYWAQIRIKKNMDVYDSFVGLSAAAEYGVEDPMAYMPFTETRAKYEAKLQNMERDSYIQFICGATPLSEYDNFVQRWLASGGEKLTADVNEWYHNK